MLEFFIHRRMLAGLIGLFITSLGIYQFIVMRRETFPEIKFETVVIAANYSGASAQETERLVTRLLEESLKSVDNIDRVESLSAEGRSLVFARLDVSLKDREITQSVNDIRQAVNQIPDLPREVKAPVVYQMTADYPLVTLSVAGADEETRWQFVQSLTDSIEDIPGVSKVETVGKRAKEIWVEVDAKKLARYQISLEEVARALQSHNVDLAAGSRAIGKSDLLIRTVAAFENIQDINEVVVRANDARQLLKVRDVAHVREAFAEDKVLARANGKAATALMVRKKKQADTIKIVKAIKNLKKELEPKAERLGLEMVTSDDWAFLIERRLNVMKSNMIQGGILILIALFLFLDWRLALVAAWGVPISFAAALALLAPFGLTINLISLLAFIIVLGMLDDDSVVVAENIYRHLEMGEPPMVAAVRGAREVIVPVLGSVATTSAAFIPFALANGIMGKVLFMFPVIVLACFVASIFEAFLILPGHVLDVLPWGKPVTKDSRAPWQVKFNAKYRQILTWCAVHRYRFMAIIGCFFLVTCLVAKWRVKIVMFPPGVIDQLYVNVNMPEGTSTSATQEALEKIERVILKLSPSDLESVVSVVGQSIYEESATESMKQGTHLGVAVINLIPQEKRKRQTDDIVAAIERDLSAIAGLPAVTIEKIRFGPPVGKAIEVRVRGNDSGILNTISRQVETELLSIAGVSNIKNNFEAGKNELRIRPKSGDMAYASVNNLQLARQILYSFGGAEVTTIKKATEEIPIKLKLIAGRGSGALSDDVLSDLYVTNERGEQVRLRPLVSYEQQKTPEFIEHFNYKRVVTITAQVDNEKITSHLANVRLRKIFKDIPAQFPGYAVIFGGEEERTQESLDSLKIGFAVSFLLILVILAALFNSYIQPFLISLTIPIGLAGIAWALILHGKPASFMALMGGVAMTGVVVNNAIVLVDLINRQRKAKESLQEAVVEASASRLRPIFASSMTTLLGLFPTAYGFGGYEPFVAPICLTLAWGLAFAMPLTLLVIPVATLIVDDLKQRMASGFKTLI